MAGTTRVVKWRGPHASRGACKSARAAGRRRSGRAPRQEWLNRRAGPLRRRRARSRRTRSSSHALAAAWRSTVRPKPVTSSHGRDKTSSSSLPAAGVGQPGGRPGVPLRRYGRWLAGGGRTAGPIRSAAGPRLEMPSGIGRDAAVEPAERAAGWLPRIRVGSAPGRAGPGEPDAESRASNSICTGCRGTHASPCARCARWCSPGGRPAGAPRRFRHPAGAWTLDARAAPGFQERQFDRAPADARLSGRAHRRTPAGARTSEREVDPDDLSTGAEDLATMRRSPRAGPCHAAHAPRPLATPASSALGEYVFGGRVDAMRRLLRGR